MVFIKFNNKIYWKDNVSKINIDKNYYYKVNGKMLKSLDLDFNDTIEIFRKVEGGKKKKTAFGILNPILKPIIKPVKTITKSVLGLAELVVEIMKLFPNLVMAIMTYITNPSALFEAIITGVKEGIK